MCFLHLRLFGPLWFIDGGNRQIKCWCFISLLKYILSFSTEACNILNADIFLPMIIWMNTNCELNMNGISLFLNAMNVSWNQFLLKINSPSSDKTLKQDGEWGSIASRILTWWCKKNIAFSFYLQSGDGKLADKLNVCCDPINTRQASQFQGCSVSIIQNSYHIKYINV